MSAFGFGATRTLARLAVPWLVALLLAALALWNPPPPGAGDDAVAALGLWLHLPGFVLALVAIASALDLWPALGRDRPGSAWLEQLPSATADAGRALLGSSVALGIALAAIGVAFAFQHARAGAPAPRAHLALVAEGEPTLDSRRDRLVFRGDGATPVGMLELRPTVFLASSRDFAAVTLRATVDGVPLLEEVGVRGSRERIQLELPPRPITRLELTRTGGRMALHFEPDAVVAVGAQSKSALVNGALAAISYLGPALLGLAAAFALRRSLAPVPLQATALGAFGVATLSGLAPNTAAVAAFARGRWLPAEALTIPGLSCFLGAMALGATALVIGRR